ncbi:MAG: nucleotide pyrophosphohydrolase [Anaerolineales bacterium]|nr:nucleotide pyrophosphohydrolase [Anaerolineales bacterium]MCB8962662.1 nucleotide pyrophosphohydrolase [Ardenticatenales bacterium]MCB0009266.1 nucleotide pyrophosphohydrolase [Anaerolineales bacterium]MCB0012589.1 nucleotide pyrophosphohydrolase [Anaerolineales bacterium]MCB0018630.1 nucleotide pyrophosphohydrolase [Anaerolineales bacterium]
MELKELEQRMHQFVASKGWYEAGSPKEQSPRNLAMSLCIEAAEVLEHFQWQAIPAEKGELAGELADVALYLLQLASILDIDLETAILDKLAYNQTREWPAK